MRIDNIDVITFSYVSRMFSDAEGHSHPGPEHKAHQSIVRITTTDGVEGHAVVGIGLPPGSAFLPEPVRGTIIGEDPLSRERIWQQLRQFQRLYRSALPDRTISAIDLALWDLAGKAAGLPASKLLGGFREKVPAYASTMCGDDVPGGLDSPEAYADFAERCVARGFKAFKLHTWMPPFGRDPRRDIAACEAVRKRVGPDIDLMLDPYHDYSRTEAHTIGRALERLDYHWLEEPMNEASMSSYVWLSDQLDIPVLGPETAGGFFYTRAEWIVNRASDISRYDVSLGGLTALMKCVHLCEAHGVGLEVHLNPNGGAHGNLQALGAMGIPGEYFELGLLHPHFDFASAQPWLEERPDMIDSDGFVAIPQLPGLGWKFDWDFIRKNEAK
jgi:L-alanine-DL-glutamate epimerase-like enolase superfamily enzyme